MSHYFNMTANQVAVPGATILTASTSSPGSAGSSSILSSSSSSFSGTDALPADSSIVFATTSPSKATNRRFQRLQVQLRAPLQDLPSIRAKVGLDVGIPTTIILGLIAGWFFFGRQGSKRKQLGADTSAMITGNFA